MCSLPFFVRLSLAFVLALPLCLSVSRSQELSKGVGVQMAQTSSALAFPTADDVDAWIIAVTADGRIYFGVRSVTPDQLAEAMKIAPRRRDQDLYIKADANAPFASVEKALAAAREDLFQSAVLLASCPNAPHTGTIAPPMGLQVMLTAPATAESVTVAVDAGGSSLKLRINNKETPSSALEDTLKQILQNQREKVVSVAAKGRVSFAQLIHIVDVAHSIGATVVLESASL